MKPTVYLETTVISYLTARQSSDLVLAAQQQITCDWWSRRGLYDLYVSDLVITEASSGDLVAAKARLDVLQAIEVLGITEQSISLAEILVSELAIPPAARRDAIHVAVAAANGIDYLLTWNCRHLANLHQRARIERVCREHGFEPPLIGTPYELQEEPS
jgi:predicted nucleic acid-binding protein